MNQNFLLRFIRDLHYLNRSICSPDFDRAIDTIKEKYVPELEIDAYPTGSDAWSWTLPRKWTLRHGKLSHEGKTIISTSEEPLSVWSGSLPVSSDVSWEELKEHLYSEPARAELLCWYFRYYGKLDWGFNLPHNLLKQLPSEGTYHVEIDAEYTDSDFRVGYAYLKGKRPETVLITSDICHPYQCNDSLTGAAINARLYQKLKEQQPELSYLFTFVPETIGTIAVLANHEEWLENICYSFYSEFWGRSGKVHLQQSLRGDSFLDRSAKTVLEKRFRDDFKTLPFRKGGIMNDERVTMLTNLWIPSVAMNRGMYPEYHSHRDTPERLDLTALEEGYEIVSDMIEEMEKHAAEANRADKGPLYLSPISLDILRRPDDYCPQPLFKGPLFLSKYDLWVDWRSEPELNAALDLIMALMDGRNSVAQIAAFVNLPFERVRNFIEKLHEKQLVQKMKKMV